MVNLGSGWVGFGFFGKIAILLSGFVRERYSTYLVGRENHSVVMRWCFDVPSESLMAHD